MSYQPTVLKNCHNRIPLIGETYKGCHQNASNYFAESLSYCLDTDVTELVSRPLFIAPTATVYRHFIILFFSRTPVRRYPGFASLMTFKGECLSMVSLLLVFSSPCPPLDSSAQS